MKGKNPRLLLSRTNSNNINDTFPEVMVEAVVAIMVVGETLNSQSSHADYNPINDNYCAGSPTYQVQKSPQMDQSMVEGLVQKKSCSNVKCKFARSATQSSAKTNWKLSNVVQREVVRTVFCHSVVTLVSITSMPGQPQKKGVRPNLCVRKIKLVKDIFCVDHCFSAPHVLNIPSVTENLHVGGTLQKFWQV